MQSLSVIIPAYNEQNRLPLSLPVVFEFLSQLPLAFLEVVVVDDGSTDRTAVLVEEAAARYPGLRLLRNPGNRGKGYAVRHGMQSAQGEWVLITDADLSAPIEELRALAEAAEGSGADGAIGSRALNRQLVGRRQSWARELSGRFFNVAMRLITGLPYLDTQCGFKLFHRQVVQCVAARQAIEGFGFDVEILYIARKHGYRIPEVPVRWFNAEGTKVSLWKGLAAFADLLRVRWNSLRGRYD